MTGQSSELRHCTTLLGALRIYNAHPKPNARHLPYMPVTSVQQCPSVHKTCHGMHVLTSARSSLHISCTRCSSQPSLLMSQPCGDSCVHAALSRSARQHCPAQARCLADSGPARQCTYCCNMKVAVLLTELTESNETAGCQGQLECVCMVDATHVSHALLVGTAACKSTMYTAKSQG